MARIVIKPAPQLEPPTVTPHLASGVGTGPNSFPYSPDKELAVEAKTNIRNANNILQTPPHPATWFAALGEGLIGIIDSARLRPLAYGLGCLALFGALTVCGSLFLVLNLLRR